MNNNNVVVELTHDEASALGDFLTLSNMHLASDRRWSFKREAELRRASVKLLAATANAMAVTP